MPMYYAADITKEKVNCNKVELVPADYRLNIHVRTVAMGRNLNLTGILAVSITGVGPL